MKIPLLEVKNLEVSFDTYAGEIHAVRGVSFNLHEGETLALVGESGCGKSVTAQTIMKLNPMPPAKIKQGNIIIEGMDLVALKERQMAKIRGSLISMIFQDPMTCLNPTMTVGAQIAETLVTHGKADKEEAFDDAIDMLEIVNMPNAEKRARQYPHEFSGGMRQRAMIALALACSPKLLIADEPTTALDVTIQAQIIDIMKDLQRKLGTSIILITHDLGVVADIAHNIAVMYAGKIVEMGSLNQIFYQPRHPYTQGLLKSVPRLDQIRNTKLYTIPGTPPDLFSPPKGCPFADRCEQCMNVCKEQMPFFYEVGKDHICACWLLSGEVKYMKQAKEGGPNNNE